MWSYKLSLRIVALVVILIALTAWAMERTQVMLNHTLEQTVARQAADLSIMAEERFGQEFEALSYAAKLLAASPGEAEEAKILEELRGLGAGISVGILSVEGQSLSGPYLSRRSFLGLSQAFRGQNVVDYSNRDGLLFAVPIRHGQNVRAVLYRLYDNAVLSNRFRLTVYHPSVRLLLFSNTGQIIVPYQRYGAEDKAFFANPIVTEAFANIRQQLSTRRAASTYVNVDGKKCFLFASNLPETNCAVAGYIPWTAVARDIAMVYERLLRSIGLISLIALAAGAYLFQVRKKAAESDALRREKAAANLANQAKSEFLANMSHEIRTPINAVLGMNEMILREGKDPAIARYARNIRSAGHSLLDIINDVLDFSKVESGKIEIVDGEYSLSEIIRNAENMARPRAESKGLSFSLNIEPTIPDRLFGDSTRVQQVLVNLLTNSAKYTERGSVEFSATHERREGEDTATFRFVVRDTGIGIRDEDKAKLFQSFERFDSVRNRGIEGTGLGLVLTKRLVELMGGEISFESVYGEGTTFFVTIPQKIVGEETVADVAAREEIGAGTSYRASFIAPEAEILVADDSEINLFVVQSLLKKTRLKIDAVNSGKAALEKLEEKRYDAVLLDHRMPGMDGVETLHYAKEMPNAEGTPFLILTADAISGSRERFLAEGFDDYLSKPLDGETLERTLAKYLPAEKLLPAPETDAEITPDTGGVAAELLEESDVLPIFDEAIGLRYCDGDKDFYRHVASLFANMFPKNKKLLEDALAHENWNDFTTYAHTLKSSSLSIGGKRFSKAAQDMETQGKILISPNASEEEKATAAAYLNKHNADFIALYEELSERARQFAAKDGKTQPSADGCGVKP